MTRRATIPIYEGDDFERMAELRREVQIAERRLEALRLDADRGVKAARLGDDEPDAIAEAEADLKGRQDAFDEFVDEAAERAESWVLEPIGHEEFRALLKDHPARKVVDEDGKESFEPADVIPISRDEAVYVNTETFPRELLTFVDPEDEDIRTVAEPRLEPAALRKRLKRLTAGEYESMWISALMLNRQGITDPKSLRYSPATLRLSET